MALSAIPLTAQAAGLGKVVVFSALGQPLRAEIEVTATREELSDMKAQLASKNAFQQAGLDYAPDLQSIRFSIDKRPSGKTVINLVSSAPINDPFIDMLLELNWPTGRLVREYTFLLDPPEVSAKNAAKVAPVAVSKPEISVDKPASSVQASAAVADEPRAKTTPPKARVQEAPVKPVGQAADSSESREVKRGDTLSKIAGATKPEGVSLEQMLVGLFRANQEAFDGGNMNRLKTGKILSIPEKSALEAVSSTEARKIVIAQSSDWNAYRSKLAAVAAQTPVKEGGAKQEVAGKITAKVEEKVSGSAEPKDQLKVSKTDTANTKYGAAAKRSEEDLVAKEKALKEANDRLVSLEKNVVNLQKLLDLKSQNLAELQQRAAEKTAPVETKKPEVVAKPQPPSQPPAPVAPVVAPEPAPVAAAPVVEKPAEAKVLEKPVEVAVKPETVKVEEKPAEAPVAEQKPADMPKPKPRPAPPPPPPEEEPGFVEELLENPIALAGGGGILALIAAYAVIRRRRAGKGEAPIDLSSTMTPTSDSLTANSVFRSTGGQSVDTSHTPVQTDFSQAGPGSIDTDEVDPVAEADVYMAYGRDAQAEEILLEAKQKDPKRYAIHLKLLEIYSNRKDSKQFESLASDIYAETGGVGADWEKAVAMGLKLDPANPLFGGAAKGAPVPSAPAPFDADATVIVSAQSMRNTVTLPGELSQLAEEASTTNFSLPVAEPVVESDLASLDFDLGLGAAEEVASPEPEKIDPDATLRLPDPVVIDPGPLDFDLAMPSLEATKIAPIR
ncbi:MAG: FimV/HubP family polar landmark protein, partial [Betaproteobacteria bacterium]